MWEIPDEALSTKVEYALEFIRKLDGAVVALSAGVDSSLVALLARKSLLDRTVAVTGVSDSLADEELLVAQRVAGEIGIKHLIIRTGELSNPSYTSNLGDRCYHCKRTLYDELRHVAVQHGYSAILDGTQTDDLTDVRPGLRSAREAGVRSPLLEAGFAKQDVRSAARLLGLSVWDKPAMPCLSSRIPTGELVTVEKLRMVDQAESFIRKTVGVRDLRVRHDHGLAKIEVLPEDRHLFFKEELMDKVDNELRRLGFADATLDLRGYSRPNRAVPREIHLPMASRTESNQ